MPKPLTPETRAKLRDHALDIRLWEHATGRQTGAKTEEGKRAAAMRALQHGLRSEGTQAMLAWLKSLQALVEASQRS